MKTYQRTIEIMEDDNYYYEEDGIVCEMNADDVVEAKREYNLYKKKEGNTYNLDWFKEPEFKRFVNLYFGIMFEGDMGYPDWYEMPDVYVCDNEDTARELYTFLRPLDYHNTFTKTFCTVTLNEKEINICRGSY